MKPKGLLIFASAGFLCALTVFGFIWNEARKEVVFLCSNFRPGMAQESVVTQLETANLLGITRSVSASIHTIHVDSVYNLGVYRCVIDIDAQRIVIDVRSS